MFPWLIFAVVTVGCIRNFSVNADADAAMSTSTSIPSQIVRARIPSQYQQHQHQHQQQQLWLYEGALYDPLDGRQVAKVQGLELVRPLENTTHLAIDSLLRHPNATFDDAKTLWSQKIFCYTKTQTQTTSPTTSPTRNDAAAANGEERILRSVRVRPQSPRKDVPLDQAVAVYETATTFISRGNRRSRSRSRSRNHRRNHHRRSGSVNNRTDKRDGIQQQQQQQHQENEDDNAEILIHSEWPNGQTMWGTAQNCRRQKHPLGGLDFTIFAKLRNRHSPLFAPDLIESSDNDNDNGGGDIIISPKRSALIQFGSSSGTMESKHKFGARETYSYRNIPSTTPINLLADNNNDKNNRWLFLWKMKFLTNNNNNNNKNSKKKNSTSLSSDGTTTITPTTTTTSVYYTRYGEGPPFYAPGRMCMLELQGRPISDLEEATPILRSLLQKDGPVANFHWNNKDDEACSSSSSSNKDDDKRDGNQNIRRPGRKKLATVTTTASRIEEEESSANAVPPSIQTAWNLKERKKYTDNGTTSRRFTSKTSATNNTSRRRSLTTAASSKHLLRLKAQTTADDDYDDYNSSALNATTAGAGRYFRVWTRRGKKHAVTLWDRVRSSTMMEAES